MIRPRLPNAVQEYAREWANAFTRAIETGFDQVASIFNTTLLRTPNGYYGSFLDTTTQTAAVINTAYPINLGTTVEALGFSVTSGSRVNAVYAGTYDFQFAFQADKTTAGVGDIYIWLRLNGVDVANSAGKIVVQGSTAQTVAAWNYVLTLAAADYIEFVWSTSSTACRLLTIAAAAPAPAIPSMRVTAHQAARP